MGGLRRFQPQQIQPAGLFQQAERLLLLRFRCRNSALIKLGITEKNARSALFFTTGPLRRFRTRTGTSRNEDMHCDWSRKVPFWELWPNDGGGGKEIVQAQSKESSDRSEDGNLLGDTNATEICQLHPRAARRKLLPAMLLEERSLASCEIGSYSGQGSGREARG
ncbi:hypothetical protein NDU88_003601 [Pleurodeles waltl]|uniref:Uncharacterized protein n=1 Tax=Pleurodeles waltl TaxID=8319 RepID=A0AAV7W7F8_PLEWA|nr:hypothetical protein NDU88_003601 [Pleurodeles waltl]